MDAIREEVAKLLRLSGSTSTHAKLLECTRSLLLSRTLSYEKHVSAIIRAFKGKFELWKKCRDRNHYEAECECNSPSCAGFVNEIVRVSVSETK